MAENDDQERTESPSQRRLDEARERGQVARSRDLSGALITLAAGLGLYTMGGSLTGNLLKIMHQAFSFDSAAAQDSSFMLRSLAAQCLQAALALSPLLGLMLAAAVLAPLAIGGWTFSFQALAPDFSRMNPVSGVARMFSVRGLIELAKSLARVGVVGVVGVMVLRHQFAQFSALSSEAVSVAILHALDLCGVALIALGGSLAFIAAIDVPVALWQHHKQLRMSREELRQEAKDTEGSPEVKGRIRRVQQEQARRRMMQEVARADVVITNPTHYAVALRYDDARMRAPVVVAKGRDLVAARIRELAAENQVPIVEAPPLARALHANCELGDEIPARLYAAVAQVLTYVYQLRHARRLGLGKPATPRFDAPLDPEKRPKA
ncbi:MAG TPA: flagellar biosynthesis protein FlhB [Steroidobacteraceae bacterium]|nr:flagellar biosynthesis protein FlhB [Steroidobacteraceae bacterium]